MKNTEKKSYDSTIGLLAAGHGQNRLVRFESTLIGDTVTVVAVSGHNLEPIKQSPVVVISREKFNNRDSDPYDSVVEFRWFAALCGWELNCGNKEYCRECGTHCYGDCQA